MDKQGAAQGPNMSAGAFFVMVFLTSFVATLGVVLALVLVGR
jgi:hypothetical protein